MLYTYKAIVTRIVDGDTFVCDLDLGFKLWNKDIKIRLLNYNAPEVEGPEKPFGLIAKGATSNLILNKEVTLHTEKADSFGRYLGTVWLSTGENLVDLLVSKGYGVNWDGKGTRPGFDIAKTYPLKV
jgi:micrococcal nuclease